MRFNLEPLDNYLELITYGFTNPMPDTYNGPWKITAKDIVGGKINYATARKTSEKAYNALTPKSKPQINDVLLTKDGTLGRVAVVDKSNICINQSVALLRCNNRIFPKYLAYLLQSPEYQAKMLADSDGTTIKHIYITRVNKMPVYVPELSQQKSVLDVLTALDDKIELNQRINDNLERQAQALFEQRFIVEDIEGDEKPLYDFADYINGAAFKPSECGDRGLPIIKIAELKSGITNSTKFFDGSKEEKYLIHDKDILFSWSGNPDTSIDIFIWTHGEAILNQHIFNVKSNFGHRWFTFLMLKYFKPEFSRIASNKQTTGLGHVTVNDLKRLTFIFNEAAIRAFECKVSPFMEKIYSNMKENQRLTQLRDSLLPKLMSGEFDVSTVQI